MLSERWPLHRPRISEVVRGVGGSVAFLSDGADRFVLKAVSRSPREVAALVSALEGLSSGPRPVRARGGSATARWRGGRAVLYHRVPGEVLRDAQLTPARIRAASEAHGRVTRELRGVPRIGALDMPTTRAFDGSPLVRDPIMRSAAELARRSLACAPLQRFAVQVVHGDPMLENFVFGPDRAVMLDFDDAGTGLVAYDLACALRSFGFKGTSFSPARATEYRRGFEKMFPLSAPERAALPGLALIRMLRSAEFSRRRGDRAEGSLWRRRIAALLAAGPDAFGRTR